MSCQILQTIAFDQKGLIVNGTVDDFTLEQDLKGTLTKLYKSLDLEYPKFYKMDNLSKLAFLGIEKLKTLHDFSAYSDDDIALVFHNNVSSLDSDKHHQDNIAQGQVSPAIFVYTLPNILLGEIAIKNKWFGENLFVLKENFSKEDLYFDAELLLNTNKAKIVIAGWADVLDEDWQLKLYVITK